MRKEAIQGYESSPKNLSKERHKSPAEGQQGRWTDKLLNFDHDPQKWLQEYHSRSISETANSKYKRDFPVPLRRKINAR